MHATWPHPAHGGRLPEASWRWSRVRRPRTGFAHLDSGGLRGSTWAPLRVPRQELADVRPQMAQTRSVARGQKSPRWSAERRAGHGPAISVESEIGPTARRATRCGDPHQRRLGAPPPSPLEGEVPQASGADASRERGGLFEILKSLIGQRTAKPSAQRSRVRHPQRGICFEFPQPKRTSRGRPLQKPSLAQTEASPTRDNLESSITSSVLFKILILRKKAQKSCAGFCSLVGSNR